MDTAADLVKRDITPFLPPGAHIWKTNFAESSDQSYQQISRRFVISKDWNDYFDMVEKVTSTGLFAKIGTYPFADLKEYRYWYRSSEIIGGTSPYGVHLANKKWPLKKVSYRMIILKNYIHLKVYTCRNMILIFSDLLR